MRVLKHMRKRLSVMMKMTRLLASRLDSISMEERPIEQIGMEQDRLNNFDTMDSALDMGKIEKKK